MFLPVKTYRPVPDLDNLPVNNSPPVDGRFGSYLTQSCALIELVELDANDS